MKYPIISTRNLSLLPDVTSLKQITQSMSVIFLLIYPEPDDVPWYSFNAHWSPGRQTAYMDNGQGDQWHLLFNPYGAIMLGFAHEADMSPYRNEGIWPSMYEGLPQEFQEALDEPAFEAQEAVTYCIWKRNGDLAWQRGPIEFPLRDGDLLGYFEQSFPPYVGDYVDGSARDLTMLGTNPSLFWEWLKDDQEQLESTQALSVMQAIYAHEPLTQAMVEILRPGLKLESIRETLLENGYPLS